MSLRFKVRSQEGYQLYDFKINCSDIDFDQWREMIDWSRENFTNEPENWTWKWPDIYFNNEQDLLFFQLRWQ